MTDFLKTLPEPPDSKRIAVRVHPKALPFLRQGHPWLFEDSIERISRDDGRPGDVAVLFDSSGKTVLGAGLYDPLSPVRVKVLTHSAKAPPVGLLLFEELTRKAFDLRNGKLPSETDAWRVLHGDSDGFPGLAADKYAESLVIKLYSAAWFPWLEALTSILFRLHPELTRLCLRMSRELQRLSATQRFGLEDGMLFAPNDWNGTELFSENSIRFQADLKCGQKTGFFLDQRDNRFRVGQLSGGLDVLNMFSYSGGFSLYAAKGGARSVCSVDFNRHAIEDCARNFERNAQDPQIKRCIHTGISGDAFEVMETMRREKRLFDLVIVDPPSFAKSAGEKASALHSYARLAKASVHILRKGGILVFASCSSRITADELFPLILNTARNSGCTLNILEQTGHAADHPAKFRESAYLKCLYARKA